MTYPLALNSPTATDSSPSADLLSPVELDAMNARMSANADKWLSDNAHGLKAKGKTTTEKSPKRATGRPSNSTDNPFYGVIGRTTHWGRYPVFALDIIEAVARLDWHGRGAGVGGKSMPLSVRNLAEILESLPVVTTEAVMDLLRLDDRHASRYVKAIELIMPRMMDSRPRSLINQMEGVDSVPRSCQWEDLDNLSTPTQEDLAELHHDLRTLTEYATVEEYEAEILGNDVVNVVAFPARHQHPKKAEVLMMLAQGTSQSEIERLTGVQRKTVRKWRDVAQAA
ncbi:helix-turn-helix domain-containing protein [Pseudomonas viridiflava]|uniref:helix-turn-helix domain-containing protein n=1 Tax=Pseudomonas viridiflava TaxID=33069 RepID=UPI000F016759|nr:helix-turn-helix domain-containing protein [Pseudomonas viridiflava]